MNPLTREVAGGPTPVTPAPAREATPLPANFTVSMDPSTSAFDGGHVLMGGTPLRLWRLSERARTTLASWEAGDLVGDGPGAGLLARRLTSSGAFVPHPGAPAIAPDQVTVVIPVRNRPAELDRLLGTLEGLRCVVVDDASTDPEPARAAAARHGACFVGLRRQLGPAAARNEGLRVVTTALVAFVDSDCIPEPGWLSPLLAFFDDPLVAAAAPRIVPAPVSPSTVVSRYEATRSSLDRGATGGLVRPRSRIPYVPSAALVVRRAVAGSRLFDPRLRVGEDVDLVWRLDEAGWDVRYVPESRVAHDGPATLGTFVRRRASYGTSAAPLAARHRGVLAPVQASAWSVATWMLALGRRPVLAAAVLLSSVAVLARRLRGLVEHPLEASWRVAGRGTLRSAAPAVSGLSRAWAPALLLVLVVRRARKIAAALLVIPALLDWWRARHDLDVVRFTALHVADDLAYGSGVWLGCLRGRTLQPLIPSVVFHARIWSTGSLRARLGRGQREQVTGQPDQGVAGSGA